MKKLLVAITAVVLGIAGTTQQVSAHGTHDADAVWIEVIMTNLGSNETGLFPIDHPTSPGDPGGSAMQNLTIGLHDETHFQAHPAGTFFTDGHFFMLSNRNTWGTFDAPVCAFLKYHFAVDGDGNVTPAEGIWNSDQGGDPRGNGCTGQSSLWHVELRGTGTPYATVDGGAHPDLGDPPPSGGGAAGADGADGAQGPQGKQGDAGAAGADGAAGNDGAAGDQGPQGKQGDAGTNGTDGTDGTDGADAPCTPCADVTDAAVDLACEILGNNPPASVEELQATSLVIVNNLLISANICEDPCDVSAGIQAAIDAKLAE